MITNELLKELAQKSLKVALCKSKQRKDDFSHIKISDDGGIDVVFSYMCMGQYSEESEYVHLEDLEKDEDTLKKEYSVYLKQERIKKQKRDELIKKQEEDKEFEQFLKLKNKFEK